MVSTAQATESKSATPEATAMTVVTMTEDPVAQVRLLVGPVATATEPADSTAGF